VFDRQSCANIGCSSVAGQERCEGDDEDRQSRRLQKGIENSESKREETYLILVESCPVLSLAWCLSDLFNILVKRGPREKKLS